MFCLRNKINNNISSYFQMKFFDNRFESPAVYFQENRIGRAFVSVNFRKLFKLGQPYKLGQKVSNYFVPFYTPPVYMLVFEIFHNLYVRYFIEKRLKNK